MDGETSAGTLFTRQTFTAQPDRIRRMTETVQRWVRADQPVRILEIGCGTGGQLVDLAAALPLAQCTGVDVSEASIRRASEDHTSAVDRDRLRFVQGHYSELRFPAPFDLIFADSVLHLIETTSERLLPKIRQDLRPGGLLILTMPSSCLYNQTLWIVRRLLRLVRSQWTDRFILSLGKRLLHRRASEALLRERLPYMYSLPHRTWGRHLQGQFRKHAGLEVMEVQPIPHTSFAQAIHCLSILQNSVDAETALDEATARPPRRKAA